MQRFKDKDLSTLTLRAILTTTLLLQHLAYNTSIKLQLHVVVHQHMYNRVSTIRHLQVSVTTSKIMNKEALLRKEEFVMEMFNYNKTPQHRIVKEFKMFTL